MSENHLSDCWNVPQGRALLQLGSRHQKLPGGKLFLWPIILNTTTEQLKGGFQ